jgi:uncharacterized membrane protein
VALTWMRLRASFWFTPAVIVLASMAVAALLVQVDPGSELAEWSPRLFGAGASGSRAMLSAIATSMITVAGVVFSITIVTLSLTSTQYSPRVLRNFMRDGPTQVVLGVFLGIFAYCLVVLRTVRGGDEGGFIPSVAVLGGIGYALAGIAMLIFFIHHVATSIQASSILARIAAETERAIDHLFPQEVGQPREEDLGEPPLPDTWVPVPARRSGYLVAVDAERLLGFARASGRVLRLQAAVGDYVSEGETLLELDGRQAPDDDACETLRDAVVLGGQRTVEQDAAFGLQQLVDVALRALSPGVNDPTTACMCLDQMGSVLARVAGRTMPGPHRFSEGRLRVVAPAPDFGGFLRQGLRPVVRHCGGNLQVLESAATALARVAEAVQQPRRMLAVHALAGEIQIELARVRPRSRTAALRRRVRRIGQPDQPPAG